MGIDDNKNEITLQKWFKLFIRKFCRLRVTKFTTFPRFRRLFDPSYRTSTNGGIWSSYFVLNVLLKNTTTDECNRISVFISVNPNDEVCTRQLTMVPVTVLQYHRQICDFYSFY